MARVEITCDYTAETGKLELKHRSPLPCARHNAQRSKLKQALDRAGLEAVEMEEHPQSRQSKSEERPPLAKQKAQAK